MVQRDSDYVVKDGQVIIVDEFTGRLMIGRRYNEGLHQACLLSTSASARTVRGSAMGQPSYGLDTGTNLVELVEHCAQVEGIQRIRLGSLDPVSYTHLDVYKRQK